MDIKFFKEDLKFKFRVSGIIIVNRKILVEHYKDDIYCLPGGYVEFNETTENAIKREMYEETKLNFEIDKFFGIVENFFINKKNEKTHEIDFYYYLKGTDIYENLNTKIIEKGEYNDIYHNFKWVNLDKLHNYKLLPDEVKKEIIKGSNNIHLIINK